MTDKQFQKKLKGAVIAAQTHMELTRQCEAEYERRFGYNPSDVDDDFWIDCVHQGQHIPTIQEVTENAGLHSL